MRSTSVAVALLLAALLEVGGDALIRWGLRGGRAAGFIAGAAALFAYGVAVNAPRWDFGRLMGVYIAVFFIVSQIVASSRGASVQPRRCCWEARWLWPAAW
ncbi:MAG TPA: hypothetical protein VGM37_11745 [Armatimonadota bacterium]|jgi:small multidrug resistance family-3 protein